MSLDDTQVFLPEVWASHARFRHNKVAVICGDQQLTWGELNTRCNRTANAMLQAGYTTGSQVALLMSNSTATLVTLLAVMKAGACVVPISTMLTPVQVATLLQNSGARCVITDTANQALAAAAEAALDGHSLQLRLVNGPADGQWQSLDHWQQGGSTQEPPVRYSLEDAFNIIYSSGTTGMPKGIVQTHRARQHWSYSNALELRMDHRTIALATTALYSNGTWFMLLPPLFVGGTVVIMDSFSPEKWLALVEEHAVTHSFMVPTQYIGVLECDTLAQAKLGSLRALLSAGSPLRLDIKAAVLSQLSAQLFELYGFSEGFATICRPEQHHKQGSVGTPVIGFDLRIVDDEGVEVPTGEVGEIVGYGGGLMRGYHRNEALTEEAIWRDERGRTFLRSGDIGRIDSDGFLYILDRKKDMIISGGFNIFPKDIEETVGAHPAVSDVAVIGIPHPKWGETPLALVIPVPNAQLDTQALLAWANDQLAKAQRLSGIEIVDALPRNALGKVIKRELRDRYVPAS